MTTLLLISIGVAMDAAAVSASAAVVHPRLRDATALATTFGGFQVAMAVLGWLAGARALEHITAWDHWVAFALLGFIGGKMIYEALRGETIEENTAKRELTLIVLLVLGVATSIDSLAVGVTLPMLKLPMALSVGVIGLVTFAISLSAALAARGLGSAFGGKLEILGGVVLVGIGVKILVEAISF